MINEFRTNGEAEWLSALLDGESPDREADLAALRADAALAEHFRQYQRMQVLLQGLADPTPSPHFVDRTLAALEQAPRAGRRPILFVGALAATLLLAFATLLYRGGPSPAETAPVVGALVVLPVDPQIQEAAKFELALLFGPAPEDDALAATLSAFEELPEADLFASLIESAVADLSEEEPAPWTLETPEEWHYDGLELGFETHSLIFDIADTLSETEAAQLNSVLRGVLDEA